MTGNGTKTGMPSLQMLREKVGSTPLVEATLLGRQLKIPNLFLKDEGRNPSGSMADRASLLLIEKAIEAKAKTISAAAQDPGGASLAYLARAAGLECVIHVPQEASDRWAVSAKAVGARIERVPGVLMDAVEESRRAADAKGWFDAYSVPRPAAFAELGREIVSGLKASPAVIAVPTREGSALAGVWAGISERANGTRLIAATSKMGNPIVWSLAQGLDECQDLEPRHVFPSVVSEPLATYKSLDGAACVQAVRASNGWGYAADDKELENLAKQLARTENLDALPASCAGIAALHFAAKFDKLEATGVHVAVVTARP